MGFEVCLPGHNKLQRINLRHKLIYPGLVTIESGRGESEKSS